MKIKVTITGTIDVPDSWADGNCGELRTTEYRYNDQLTVEDALGELAEKLANEHIYKSLENIKKQGMENLMK